MLAFRAGLCLLWVLSFIDGSILLFQNAAKMHRLMAQVVALFEHMGLRINTKRSCVLGARLPACVSGVLAPFAVLDFPSIQVFPLKISESVDHLMTAFCHRASPV